MNALRVHVDLWFHGFRDKRAATWTGREWREATIRIGPDWLRFGR